MAELLDCSLFFLGDLTSDSEFSMRALPTLNGLIGAITVIVWALLLTGTRIHTAKDNTIDELHRDVPSASRPQPRKALSKLAEATPARSAPTPQDGDASIAPHQVAPVFRAAPKPEAYADTGALAEAPQSTGTLRELRPPDERGSDERGPVTSSPGDVASAVPSTPLSPSPGSENPGTASRAPALQAEAAANLPSVLDPPGRSPSRPEPSHGLEAARQEAVSTSVVASTPPVAPPASPMPSRLEPLENNASPRFDASANALLVLPSPMFSSSRPEPSREAEGDAEKPAPDAVDAATAANTEPQRPVAPSPGETVVSSEADDSHAAPTHFTPAPSVLPSEPAAGERAAEGNNRSARAYFEGLAGPAARGARTHAARLSPPLPRNELDACRAETSSCGKPKGGTNRGRQAKANSSEPRSFARSADAQGPRRAAAPGSPTRGAAKPDATLASLNGSQGAPWRLALRRRCPSIIASSEEYDDDLVRLCRLPGAL
jgi:hypothetical protein